MTAKGEKVDKVVKKERIVAVPVNKFLDEARDRFKGVDIYQGAAAIAIEKYGADNLIPIIYERKAVPCLYFREK